jgi:hypothetical protein
MDMQWSLIWTHSNAVAAMGKKKALADPLEGASWEGLGWAIPLISRMVSGPRFELGSSRKNPPVERFTKPAPNQGVCVS